MDEIRLTKDADALICVLYKSYIQRRKAGEFRESAKFMGGSPEIHMELMPKWSFEDVDDTCRELSRAGLLHCQFADDIIYAAKLSDESIIYMENRFKDGLVSVLGHLESLKSLIPL